MAARIISLNQPCSSSKFQPYEETNNTFNLFKSSEKSSNFKTESTKNFDLTKSSFLKPFDLNDLVWAKLKNFPWWPCQIVRDLVGDNEFHKLIGNKQMYLVEMVGCYKERAWVSHSSLFSYKGIESFKTYAQDQVDRALTKIDKERLAERFQLKVALNRRDEWEQAITDADLIIKNVESVNKKKYTNSLNLLKRRREDDNETNRIKKKIDTTSDLNTKLHSIESIRNEITSFKHEQEEEDEEEDEEEEEVEQTTSDEEDSNSFQPTSIYDFEQPIQNIYTYNSNHKNNRSEYEQPLQTINSIVTELENNKNLFNEDIEWNSSSSTCTISSPSSTSPLVSKTKTKIENHQQIFKKIYQDELNHTNQIEKKKRGRKPKIENENKNSEPNSPFSTIQSNSRKNSIKKKKLKDSSTLNVSALNPQLNDNSKLKHKDDNNQFNDLIMNENKDFDLTEHPNKPIQFEPNGAMHSAAETYLIDRYKYAVRHIRQGLSVEEACNKYRISKGALLKCLSGGTAPRGKKTRLTEIEENEIVEWLINNKDVKYNEAIHLVFEQVEQIFQQTQRPNPFNNSKPSMDWWYDFLSRHPQIMASKPDWLRRGKVNDQYIRDVQSGQLKCTKFRRALLSAIQYIRSLTDSENSLPLDNNDNPQIISSKLSKQSKKETKTDLNIKTIKQKSKLQNLKLIPTKTNVVVSHTNQQEQQVKQRQTMNSISTTIDLTKPKLKEESWVLNKTDHLLLEHTNLVDYNDDEQESIKQYETNSNTVRFDNFLSNPIITNFLYDNQSQNGLIKQSTNDSSIYLNETFNVSIMDDDDEQSSSEDDDDIDESHLMAVDPSTFI